MRTAVIQGASRGIGLELTRQLLERGDRVVATCRAPSRASALQELARHHDALDVVALDVEDEATIAAAFDSISARIDRIHLLMNVAGVLHDEHMAPEKRLRDIDAAALERAFRVNALGPLLVMRHAAALIPRDEASVIANLSARVGSIEDNRLGGWYAYRASKAAQNQFTRTAAIEMKRRYPRLIVVALHPGTVATDLSEPFRGGVPADRLFSVERAARQLLAVVGALTPADSGGFFAWDGAAIPW